jgi:hypothetical protein
MVTPAMPQEQDTETPIDYLDAPDPDVDAGLPPTDDVEDIVPETPVTEAPAGAPAAAPVSEAPSEPLVQEPQQSQVDQRAVQELHQRRAAASQQEWRDRVGQQARQYEQGLSQQGYSPAMARDQARRYVQQEQRFRQQEQEAAEFLGFIEGRQNAAMHYLEKEGLADRQVIADIRALQQANNPEEMAREARRMKQERELRAENARLKQGQVPAQTFDNSQGSAQASSSSDQRLMDAYINGDRSEAATAAVRRIMQGN